MKHWRWATRKRSLWVLECVNKRSNDETWNNMWFGFDHLRDCRNFYSSVERLMGHISESCGRRPTTKWQKAIEMRRAFVVTTKTFSPLASKTEYHLEIRHQSCCWGLKNACWRHRCRQETNTGKSGSIPPKSGHDDPNRWKASHWGSPQSSLHPS